MTLQQSRAVGHTVGIVALLAVLAVLGQFVAPMFSTRDVILESAGWPVIVRKAADGLVIDDLVLDKVAPPCKFIDQRWLADTGASPSVPLDVVRPRMGGLIVSRPAGLQSFGQFAFPNAPPNTQTIRAVWWYRCGDDVTDTAVELGPWAVAG